MGKKDLRSLFLSPEGNLEYFDVRCSDNTLVLDSKTSTTISEERLPDEGYLLIQNDETKFIGYIDACCYGVAGLFAGGQLQDYTPHRTGCGAIYHISY